MSSKSSSYYIFHCKACHEEFERDMNKVVGMTKCTNCGAIQSTYHAEIHVPKTKQGMYECGNCGRTFGYGIAGDNPGKSPRCPDCVSKDVFKV